MGQCYAGTIRQARGPAPVLNLQDSWSRPGSETELLQAKLDIERAGIQLKYDQNQLWPELDVSAVMATMVPRRV